MIRGLGLLLLLAVTFPVSGESVENWLTELVPLRTFTKINSNTTSYSFLMNARTFENHVLDSVIEMDLNHDEGKLILCEHHDINSPLAREISGFFPTQDGRYRNVLPHYPIYLASPKEAPQNIYIFELYINDVDGNGTGEIVIFTKLGKGHFFLHEVLQYNSQIESGFFIEQRDWHIFGPASRAEEASFAPKTLEEFKNLRSKGTINLGVGYGRKIMEIPPVGKQ